jgi:hypothetical protein
MNSKNKEAGIQVGRGFHIQGGNMRKRITVVVFLVAVLSASLGFAQNPNYDVGAVWRVTYMHLKPGMGDVFWNDFRQHIKPVLDEQKKQGLISDYKAFINPTTNQPNDWDVALAVLYPSWASLDQIFLVNRKQLFLTRCARLSCLDVGVSAPIRYRQCKAEPTNA